MKRAARYRFVATAGLAVLLVPVGSLADVTYEEEPAIPEEPAEEPAAQEPIMPEMEPAPAEEEGRPFDLRPENAGISISAGGGVTDFDGGSVDDFADTGGAWDVRVGYGLNTLVGFEAAYIGTAYGVDSLLEDSTLVGNGLEGNVRVNILRNGFPELNFPVQPYAFVGAAWKHYSVGDDFAASANMEDNDNVFELPLGGGVAYYFDNGIMLDARFDYRFASDEDLVVVGDDSLNNWNLTGKIGWVF